MRKMNLFLISVILGLSFTSYVFAAESTHSGKAVENASKAGSHASASAAHSIAASGQVTSAASAVPLAIGGSVGAVSGQLANESMRAATAPIGTPLQITDETLTIVPPNEALKVKKDVKADKGI